MSSVPSTPSYGKRSPLRRVGRTVVLLGFVSLFADLAGDAITPVVPLFLTINLAAPMVVVGLVEGIADSCSNIFKVASGWLSDRTGRRTPLVNSGYGLAALAKVLLAVATHWGVVAVARSGDRIGKGIRGAPRDALVVDSVDADIRGAAFGLHRAMDTAGAIGGTLLAFVLVSLFSSNLRLVFAVAVVPAFLAFLLTFLVREVPAPRRQPGDHQERPPGWRQLPRTYWMVVGVMTLFALGSSSNAFILLRAKDLGLGVSTVILAYLAFNVAYAVLAYPMGSLSDRLGRRKLILLGFALYATTYLGLAVTHVVWALWPLLVLYGAYLSIGEGVGRALVADCTPKAQRATGMGLYQGVVGGGVLLASLAAGGLWDAMGPGAPFFLGSGLAALAFLVGLRYLPDSPARATPEPGQ